MGLLVLWNFQFCICISLIVSRLKAKNTTLTFNLSTTYKTAFYTNVCNKASKQSSIPGGGWEFFSSTPLPLSLISNGYRRLLPWSKAARLWRTNFHLVPKSRNAWSYTSMAWYLV